MGRCGLFVGAEQHKEGTTELSSSMHMLEGSKL